MSGTRTNSGKNLNLKWNVNVHHALYHKDGTWYEVLRRFPGALFDRNGYVLFKSECEFRACPHLRIGEKVNVTGVLRDIPGYRKME